MQVNAHEDKTVAVPVVASGPLTWETLVTLEPRLMALLKDARAIKDNRGRRYFCANAYFFGYDGQFGLKRRVERLVGWDRPDRHPVLSTTAAYDLAYDRVYDALPACRGRCGCL